MDEIHINSVKVWYLLEKYAKIKTIRNCYKLGDVNMNKHKKSDDILVIQKYKESKIGIISMIITTVISSFCYITILFLLQNEEYAHEYSATLNVVRDILLAIISIVATSLLTSVFIEKNRKNIDYTELMANDIFASPEFYSNLSDENKQKVHRYLEQNMFLKDPVKTEIYQLCREQIYNNPTNYYYEGLDMYVSYFECENYSEKNIKRVMKIRSYKEKIREKKIYLFSYKLSPTENIKNFEILSAGIGIKNEPLVIGKDIVVEKKKTTNMLMDKCGYTETYEVYLCKDVVLSCDSDIILNIEYVSRVADEDMSAGFGVFVPCKKFSFNFMAPQGYIVYAHSFSFFNSEINFPNSAYKNSISVCFDNWLLPGEGLVVCVAKSLTSFKATTLLELGNIEE